MSIESGLYSSALTLRYRAYNMAQTLDGQPTVPVPSVPTLTAKEYLDGANVLLVETEQIQDRIGVKMIGASTMTRRRGEVNAKLTQLTTNQTKLENERQ
jgi:hypothetical protein